MRILLLEDDTVLGSILLDFLEESYEVVHVISIQEALRQSETDSFDLYIFDINLPDGDGISLLKEIRAFKDETPVIFITAYHDSEHLKNAFLSGGNDFIRKPFELEELQMRVENIKRHFGLSDLITLCENCIFDLQKHTVTKESQSYTLSAKESRCLHYLYQNRHRVVSTDELLQNLWEFDEMPSGDSVRTLIKQLRKVIGKEHIVNIRGEGYRFE